MKSRIEQQLIASKPKTEVGNTEFISATMHAISTRNTLETFETVVRTTNTNNRKQGAIRMKLRSTYQKFKALPNYVAAIIVIGSAGTVGAAGYAGYRWIVPNVTVNNVKQDDEGKKLYTVTSQCGELASGKSLQYELSRGSHLTDADALKVFKNTCAYDALRTFIAKNWVSDNDQASFSKKKPGDLVTIYDFDNNFAGSTTSNPVFGLTLGNITNIDAHNVTITLPLYSVDNSAHPHDTNQPFDYYPAGKIFSRSLALAPSVTVLQNGKNIPLASLHAGDQIQVVTRTQNVVKYYADIHQNALGPQKTFDVVGIIKTNFEPAYISNAGAQVGNPAIVNALASLHGCFNNESYLCVSASNQILGQVYSSAKEGAVKATQSEYIRPDANDPKKTKTYTLDGRITHINGKHLTLQTRGHKATFTVDLPIDAIPAYNSSHQLGVQVGDLIDVLYAQSPNENHLQIQGRDILSFGLFEQTQPDGSVVKY